MHIPGRQSDSNKRQWRKVPEGKHPLRITAIQDEGHRWVVDLDDASGATQRDWMPPWKVSLFLEAIGEHRGEGAYEAADYVGRYVWAEVTMQQWGDTDPQPRVKQYLKAATADDYRAHFGAATQDMPAPPPTTNTSSEAQVGEDLPF